MPLPKHLLLRGDTYYVRRPVPLDVQPAFGRQKQIWRSLGTTSRKEAEANSHAVLAAIEAEIEAKRRGLRAAAEEREFLSSARGKAALREYQGVAGRVGAGTLPFADDGDAADKAWAELAIKTGQAQAAPTSRAAVLEAIDHDLAELEREGATAYLRAAVDHDGTPDFGFPERYREAMEARLRELIEADRRTLEAQKAIVAATDAATSADPAEDTAKGSLTDLSALWQSQKTPARSSQADMRTAIVRFQRVNGPLPYADVTDEHARRFKADLVGDASLKNATRQKLWGMLRALLNVAVDDGLLTANPFVRVKLRLEDDSAQREVLTTADLEALFGRLTDREEWWITRLALYTGARLGEICQLTKADLQTVSGVACLHIREDAEAGKSVETRSSIRKVPLHRQLIADGFPEWVKERQGDTLFSVGSAAASKRLLRRMRDAGMGEGKVFHSLRHTFKGVARRQMDSEWHDRLTGHAPKSVGHTYGDYDLRTLKEKIDKIAFGVETPAASSTPAATS